MTQCVNRASHLAQAYLEIQKRLAGVMWDMSLWMEDAKRVPQVFTRTQTPTTVSFVDCVLLGFLPCNMAVVCVPSVLILALLGITLEHAAQTAQTVSAGSVPYVLQAPLPIPYVAQVIILIFRTQTVRHARQIIIAATKICMHAPCLPHQL
ncbi:hypothetical protein N9E76_01125 [bacterium]|nr:hypothetical protein [bacterium]